MRKQVKIHELFKTMGNITSYDVHFQADGEVNAKDHKNVVRLVHVILKGFGTIGIKNKISLVR